MTTILSWTFSNVKRLFANAFGFQNNIENLEPIDEIASGKRRHDENTPEVIVSKKRKLDPISVNGFTSSFSTLIDPSNMATQKRLRSGRTNNKKILGNIEFSNTPNTRLKHSIYSCDGPDVDNSNDLTNCKVLLQRTDYTRGYEFSLPRKMSTRQASSHANSLYSSHVCHRSSTCLDRITQEQSKDVFLEIMKKCSSSVPHGRKALPLTTSTVHNTKQNKQFASNTPSIKRYYLRQSTLFSNQTPAMEKIISAKESVADRTIVDLTNDDDDDNDRHIIETKVRNSSQLKNYKCSFVGKNAQVVEPDYIDSLIRKYDLRQRTIDTQVQKMKKNMQKNREDVNKSLVEILEKRLVLKEHVAEEQQTKDLAPITNEMKEEMRKILSLKRHPLARIKDTSVKVEDFYTLRDYGWLNDEIINAYMNLIKIRSEQGGDYPKVHCFNTFFYPQLLSRGYSSVRRWTKKIDIFDHDLIIVPIHLGNHWCLAEVRVKEQVVKYYDSFGSRNNQCLETILQYLINEHEDKKGKALNATKWKIINVPRDDIPYQKNGYDCGVFACTYAEHLTRNASFNFLQEDMSYFREKMKYEILTGSLIL